MPRGSEATVLYLRTRRAIDLSLGLVLLVATWPLLLLALVLVRLTSRGPAIYRQLRLGQHGRPFVLFKIRTMTHDCERQSGPCWARPRDPRITFIGRYLRRAHLDELPQLWNVVRGEMSLIGPRPERPEFVPQLALAIPGYRQRLQIRPGITGLAQVVLPADSDLDSVRRKLAFDLHGIQHAGLWLDVRILLATALHLVGVPRHTVARWLWFPTLAELGVLSVPQELGWLKTMLQQSPSPPERVISRVPAPFATRQDTREAPKPPWILKAKLKTG